MKAVLRKILSVMILFTMTAGALTPAASSCVYATTVKTPKKVSITKSTAGTKQVELQWKAQNCSGYEIYRKTGNGKWVLLKQTTSKNAASKVFVRKAKQYRPDKGLKTAGQLNIPPSGKKGDVYFVNQSLKNGTYRYKIRAYNTYKKNGKIKKKYGAFSKVIKFKVKAKKDPGKTDNKKEEEPVKPVSLAGTTIHFSVLVNVYIGKQDFESFVTKEQEEIDYDNAVLSLPDSYTEKGEPTRLVIWCHGAGSYVSSTDSDVENSTVIKYLVANGYAVMDVNGLPFKFADKHGIDKMNNVGCPIAIDSYVKAYQYVIEHYNIRKDGVFVGGGSMGGLSSSNLVMSGRIPVIAHGALCPVLDTYHQAWLNPWSYGLPKTALTILYGFPKLVWSRMYIASKVKGYNPIENNTTTVDGKKCTDYPCPVKFWHCEDDTTVDPETTKTFVQQIKNTGGEAYLVLLPNGGHSPERYGEPLQYPSGNTNYRGETLQISPVAEDVLLWFNSFF